MGLARGRVSLTPSNPVLDEARSGVEAHERSFGIANSPKAGSLRKHVEGVIRSETNDSNTLLVYEAGFIIHGKGTSASAPALTGSNGRALGHGALHDLRIKEEIRKSCASYDHLAQ